MRKTNITVRKANLKDLEEIKRLNQELFHHDFKFDKTLDLNWPENNEEYYKKRITETSSIALIAECEKNIVGYLIGAIKKAETYRTIKKIAELENMIIIQDYRNKGIGKELVNNFVNWAKTNKIRRLKVVASAQNNKAIGFYRKIGFSDSALALEANI